MGTDVIFLNHSVWCFIFTDSSYR